MENPNPATVTVRDTVSFALKDTAIRGISDPITLPLKSIGKLDFTSGGSDRKDIETYCDTSAGFYGRYHLFEKGKYTDPVVGFIDIHKKGTMDNWRASDSDQTMWKIHVRSNLVALWDSIMVGNSRDQITRFCTSQFARGVKKEELFCACDIGNFAAVFIFQNDTVKEITVSRKCSK